MARNRPKSIAGADSRHAAPLSGRSRARFEAIQRTLVPLSDCFDETERRASLALVNRTLDAQPAGVRRQLALLLAGLDVYCALRHRRMFRNLPRCQRQRVVDGLANARPALLRKGMEGLAALAKLGVYGQPGLHPALGYRLRENPDA